MIELRGLHKSFGQNHVLAGVDLSIERGKSMVIIGGSGTGKSVLLKSILGLITPDQGTNLGRWTGCNTGRSRRIFGSIWHVVSRGRII